LIFLAIYIVWALVLPILFLKSLNK
jgi:hypothetical protein